MPDELHTRTRTALDEIRAADLLRGTLRLDPALMILCTLLVMGLGLGIAWIHGLLLGGALVLCAVPMGLAAFATLVQQVAQHSLGWSDDEARLRAAASPGMPMLAGLGGLSLVGAGVLLVLANPAMWPLVLTLIGLGIAGLVGWMAWLRLVTVPRLRARLEQA